MSIQELFKYFDELSDEELDSLCPNEFFHKLMEEHFENLPSYIAICSRLK